MNLDQITGLVASGESETLEFKETTGARPRGGQDRLRLPEPGRRAGAVRCHSDRGRRLAAGRRGHHQGSERRV